GGVAASRRRRRARHRKRRTTRVEERHQREVAMGRCAGRDANHRSGTLRSLDHAPNTLAGSGDAAYDTAYVTEGGGSVSVRHALLALLSEGPKYGLQLRQEFEARTGEVWPLNIGQVYTTLQRLERDGVVESDDTEMDGPRKGFRITSAGRAELDEWPRTPPA